MTMTATKKPVLKLGKLSAVAQIAINPSRPADAQIELARIYSVSQVRKTFRNLDELAESFKLNGIIEPLVVHEEVDPEAGDVKYRLIVGERRFRAAPLAGLKKVPVVIKKDLDDLQIRRLQISENNDRDDLTAFEEAMGVIEDVDRYGTKNAAEIWNRGEAWISKRVAVRRYADPVRALLENGQCNDFETLHCLNQLFKLNPARFNRIQKNGIPMTREEARAALALAKKEQQTADIKQPTNDVDAMKIKLKKLTPETLDSVVAKTRLGKQAQSIAHTVLVDGKTQSEAAAEYGVTRQRVNLVMTTVNRAYDKHGATDALISVQLALPERLATEFSALAEALEQCSDQEKRCAVIDKVQAAVSGARRRL